MAELRVNRGRVDRQAQHFAGKLLDRFWKMQEQTQFEPLMNDAQAADFLGGLHPKTVQRMARRGELPHYRVGKYYRYRASELDEWLRLHSKGQNPSASHSKGDAFQ